MIPSTLLLHYFEIAQHKLGQQQWLDEGEDELQEVSNDRDISWHRNQIVKSQLESLDEAISKWQQDSKDIQIVDKDYMQSVLRQIGLGDYTCVTYDISSSNNETTNQEVEEEQQQLLKTKVEETNELARRSFARSVLLFEWRRLESLDRSESRELQDDCNNIDGKSILEYCGLVMAAVRLPEVQKYLQSGNNGFIYTLKYSGKTSLSNNDDKESCDNKSVQERLLHIQKLYWHSLGLEPNHASNQLNSLLLGGEESNSTFDSILKDSKVMETLTQYISSCAVATTNADISNKYGNNNDGDINANNASSNNDGTTRVVSVSYSEKIITANGDMTTENSLSTAAAPTSNTIDEHALSQQRREMNNAKATAMLQTKLWEDFQSLPMHEQMKTVEKAKVAHRDFIQKIESTPPGQERIVLMQNMDGEMQRLLVIYKLWSSSQ